MKYGLLFRPGSFWIGVHWSKYNRRFCVNVVPMVTIWITLAGGVTPEQEKRSNEIRAVARQVASQVLKQRRGRYEQARSFERTDG